MCVRASARRLALCSLAPPRARARARARTHTHMNRRKAPRSSPEHPPPDPLCPHTRPSFLRTHSSMYVCVYVCMYVCMYVCILSIICGVQVNKLVDLLSMTSPYARVIYKKARKVRRILLYYIIIIILYDNTNNITFVMSSTRRPARSAGCYKYKRILQHHIMLCHLMPCRM